MAGIPFKAALFDLDGTLLDSMYVWSRVDEVFFAARGIRCRRITAARLRARAFASRRSTRSSAICPESGGKMSARSGRACRSWSTPTTCG